MFKNLTVVVGFFALAVAAGIVLLPQIPATAQGNPTCPTRPTTDNSNACASTAFVQNAFGGGSLVALTNGHIFVGNVSNLAIDVAPGGGLVASGTSIQLNPITQVAHQWINSISPTGIAIQSQPACADLSTAGTACTANTGTSGATVPFLNGNNTFSGGTIFTTGIAIGASAPLPGTPDIYRYSATAAPQEISTRDQILSTGISIGDDVFKGKNASGTTISWVDNFAAPPFCRGRPSLNGFPCAQGTFQSGTEEGAFYITNIANNAISLATTATSIAGTSSISFASSVQDSGNLIGRTVVDTTHSTAIPAGTFVVAETATRITISQLITSPGVSNGDTITFTGNDQTWFDSNGINVGGQRNLYLPAGQGVVSFDSTGTATYVLSFNSHANDEIDLQACNDIGHTCSGGFGTIALMTASSTNAGRKVVIDNTAGGQTELRSHLSIRGVTGSVPTIGGAWTVAARGSGWFGGDSGGHLIWTAGTSGTITFGTPMPDSASCVVTFRAGVTGQYAVTVNLITITSLSAASGIMDWVCMNSPGN